MSFGYPTQYANGLNSSSQLRRSTDMIYQRGGEYEVILTGTTYSASLELQVQLFADDRQVGAMSGMTTYQTMLSQNIISHTTGTIGIKLGNRLT